MAEKEQRARESVLSEAHKDLCPEMDKILFRELGITKRTSQNKLDDIVKRCSTDPEFYIFGGFVRTIDEKDRVNPRKTVPRKTYMYEMLKHIHETKMGEVVAITKSRQIMMSWLLAAYASWEARFHPHARVMYQSKVKEDALKFIYNYGFLHSRVAFIERAVPRFMRSNGLRGVKGHLIYANGANIESMPKGSDAARGTSASLYLFDEAAFQDNFRKTFKAVLPVAKGDPTNPNSGGRILMVTTANGGSDYATIVEETPEFNYHAEAKVA